MSKRIIIYKLTFPNGKVYIGQTNKELKYRFNNGLGYVRGHGGKISKSLISLAIIKYGWCNVKNEVLCEVNTQEEADEKEKYFISLFNSTNQCFGYNQADGGKTNYLFNVEYKNARKGVHLSPKTEFKKGREATNKKKVYCFETNTTYSSIQECATQLNLNPKHNHIADVCLGKRKQTNGFHFKYAE